MFKKYNTLCEKEVHYMIINQFSKMIYDINVYMHNSASKYMK